jgi:hypothetical protein
MVYTELNMVGAGVAPILPSARCGVTASSMGQRSRCGVPGMPQDPGRRDLGIFGFIRGWREVPCVSHWESCH